MGSGDGRRSGPRTSGSFVRDNGLSLFFLTIFLLALLGQAISGHRLANDEELQHGGSTMSLADFLLSPDFARAVLENWQSEYLQFLLYVVATVWLVQRGSPESKPRGRAGTESEEDQRIGAHAEADSPRWARLGGWRTRLYSNSLALVMGLIFLASWAIQSVAGWKTFNSSRIDHDQATIAWTGYLVEPEFWESTFQNWQSEFLAVGSMAVLSVYLRQRGSPESKPVGASHGATGTEG